MSSGSAGCFVFQGGSMQQTLRITVPETVQKAAEPALPPRRRVAWRRLLIGPAVTAALVAAWQLLGTLSGLPPFILPTPLLVAERWWQAALSGLLWQHTAYTLQATLGGFAAALVIALVLGYILAHARRLERVVTPLLAASQAIPVVAVAPLVILWLGTGSFSRIVIAALITFLPMLISTITAIRGIPRELVEMARINGARRLDLVRYVELPLALPVIFAGVRSGLALATTGAVVGEFVAGRYGLGALINIARGLFDTPLIFVALVTLALLTMSFYLAATLLERLLVRWEQ
jgi:NitT/TauT family transport system permease protein